MQRWICWQTSELSCERREVHLLKLEKENNYIKKFTSTYISTFKLWLIHLKCDSIPKIHDIMFCVSYTYIDYVIIIVHFCEKAAFFVIKTTIFKSLVSNQLFSLRDSLSKKSSFYTLISIIIRDFVLRECKLIFCFRLTESSLVSEDLYRKKLSEFVWQGTL